MTTTYTFQNYCKWNSTTAGTGSFNVGSAYTADAGNPHDIPANLGAVNGNTYRYYATSADGTQYESGSGVYSSGVLSRVTITNNSDGTTSAVNFATNPIVDMFPHARMQLDGQVVVTYTPVNRAGDTMTGSLLVNGVLGAGPSQVSGTTGDLSSVRTSSPTTGAVFLGNSGSHYLYFDGSNYQLGSSGTPWTTGNITPVISLRTALAGTWEVNDGGVGNNIGTEPFGPTAFATAVVGVNDGSTDVWSRYRYLQFQLSNGSWFNFNAI